MLTLEFALVDTRNGFDFYAVWDGIAWLDGSWVRVVEGAPLGAVEDAFYRNEMVSNV